MRYANNTSNVSLCLISLSHARSKVRNSRTICLIHGECLAPLGDFIHGSSNCFRSAPVFISDGAHHHKVFALIGWIVMMKNLPSRNDQRAVILTNCGSCLNESVSFNARFRFQAHPQVFHHPWQCSFRLEIALQISGCPDRALSKLKTPSR
jgi:hypothetical protein